MYDIPSSLPTDPTPTKATLIFNPAAGQRDVRGALRSVVGYLAEHGWQVVWKETTPELDATTLTYAAIADGADVVIAAGGDGTINGVVNGLVGQTHVRLGILPTGTANVWANESGISQPFALPADLEAAAAVLIEGTTLTIDVGKANDRYFLLVAGIGLDGIVTRHTDAELKRHIGPFAYVVSTIKEALQYRGAKVKLTIDGETLERPIWWVTVSNSKNYALVPFALNASVTDGYLDIGVFGGRSWRDILWHAVQIALRRHPTDPNIEFLRGKAISVEASPPLPVQIDAEPYNTTPMRFEVVPGALNIIVPKGAVNSL